MSRKHSIKKIFAVALLSVFIAFFGVAVSVGFTNAQKVIYGIKLAGIDVGGMKFDDAKNEIQRLADEFSKEKTDIMIGKDQYQTMAGNIGAYIDVEKTLASAAIIGRDSNFLFNFSKQFDAMVNGKSVDLVVGFDDDKLEGYLREFEKYEVKKQDASLYFDEVSGDFLIQPSIEGNKINRQKLKSDIIDLAKQSNDLSIELSFAVDKEQITNEMAESARDDARDFLGKHTGLDLKYHNKGIWSVDKKTLGDWIGIGLSEDAVGLEVFWDKDEISKYLTTISQNINQEPVDAVLVYKNNKVEAFSLSRDGKYINVEKSADAILNILGEGKKEVTLEMDSVKAKIDMSEIDNLGLTSLIATGESDFAGSPANRVHNIKVGTAKFNGILIAPGEEFSFVGHLGEVGAAEGYLPELVIKNNKTIPEYGGGICQVSTTMFRAAMIAGLEIKERYPHSFPVKYYAPQGFDAAIYPPSPDLKFVNDTPNNILIQSKVKGTKVYFEFYGTDDGRKVVLTGPEEYDKKPDGSMKTKLTREIFDKDGGLIRKTVFRSSYKSPDLYPVVRNPLE